MTSFLDELRAVRESILAQSTKTLPVNGANGRLAVRFKPPEDEAKLTGIIGAYISRGELSREQAAQLLIDCQGEVLHRNGPGDLEPYDPPLRFDGSDERWQADTARGAVAELYNLDLIPLALGGTVDELIDWLQGLDVQASDKVEREGKDAGQA